MQLPAVPKAVLVDLAGVLYVGEQALPGARAALARLRASGLAVHFLTNTTRSPRSAVVALLQRLGFAIDAHEIHTAARATRDVVAHRGLHPHYLVHPDIAAEMGASHATPDAVVVGDAGPHFTFERLNAAFRLLMEGLPLIAMARNRYFREADGLTLDAGAFICALEYAAGVRAEVIGKPASPFFLAALEALGAAPATAVLIGDDLHDDIGGAQRAGIPAILVRTGKYRTADEADPAVRPAHVADDFAAAVDAILGAAA
jgi:HAD superfamily hydrolase (TIGR01458 family)